MKRIGLLFFLLFFVTGAHAENPEKHFFTNIGLQTYHHDYEEPGVMEQDGMFLGVSYSIGYEKDWLLKLEGHFAAGEVDYSSTSTGSMNDKDNFNAEARGIVGYSIYNKGKLKIIPYTGAAFRLLQDDSQNRQTTTGHWGYDRESQYFYSPIGIAATYRLKNGWRLKPELEYDLFWFGEQKSDLGYLAGYEDIENDQDSGYGVRLSLAIEKEFRKFSIMVKPFYRYWDIDESDKTTDSNGRTFVEPANETVEYGVDISFFFF
ncbi:MAG: hypothetical protein MI863_12665 [Desulfobacterales bacterium]|nr:hypothetical protein [Desulfobacterales bacterium]